jgi:hypothetical protein
MEVLRSIATATTDKPRRTLELVWQSGCACMASITYAAGPPLQSIGLPY